MKRSKGDIYKLVIHRFNSFDKIQTKGDLFVFKNGVNILHKRSLELPFINNQHNISCIPKGTYKGRKCLGSPHFKYIHIDVLNVPDRSGIKIHIGNYISPDKSQSRGCIFPGESFGDINGDGYQEILNSADTLKSLIQILPDEFIIEIK